MIEFQDVDRYFGAGAARGGGRIAALRGVTLSIPRGGVWAVVGPNGAGKTTLFGLLLGFLHPGSGSVRIAGEEPRRYLRRHGAAYLPERFRLPGEWRVGAALQALARLEGLSAAAAAAAADGQVERFGLGLHAAKPLHALSRGLLQRVGLAQALLARRELVVLDEPTEGLDPLWRIHFRELIDELRADGRTVLIATHDLAEVERLAERAVLLEGGQVREVMTVARPTGEPIRYRLVLEAPSPAVEEAFPGAARVEGGGESYLVTVADPAELSGRLAALLAAGAVVSALLPATEALEERVRRALGGGDR